MSRIRKENRNAILGAVLAVGLAVGVVIPAYAFSISGTVEDTSGSGLSNPKVTAERVGEYAWDRGSSSGAYSIDTATSNTYTVSAMRPDREHEAHTGVSGGASNEDFTLSSRNPITVRFQVVADEEFRNLHGIDWQDVATDKLMDAEPWFQEEHSIEFSVVAFASTWNTQSALNNADCGDFGDDMMADTFWPGINPGNADIIFGITGESLTQIGCAITPGSGGQEPPVVIMDNFSPHDLLVMHELTHSYGQSERNTGYYDVMQTDIDLRIKNWEPDGDGEMEDNRNWY